MLMFEKIIRYRYWILFGFFALWMLFFDSNNVFYRISIGNDISELQEMRDLHVKEIARLQREKTELFGNMRNIEKFAREKYLMKRDNEDLFVIIRDSTESK
jgi:cell division protein FtsB